MDIATLIGLLAAVTVVSLAILTGGSPAIFLNVPALLIVVGGTLAVTFVKFAMSEVFSALILGAKTAFGGKTASPINVINDAKEFAKIARTQGHLGLESVEIAHPLFAHGIRMCVDGYEPQVIRETMNKERDTAIEGLAEGERIFKGMGDSAPAFGMIGTLVGLVQMLVAMDDPSSIGPAMAVALLTTLYGALIANVVCLPVAEKLNVKRKREKINMNLIIESTLLIHARQSPMVIEEILRSYLSSKEKSKYPTDDEAEALASAAQ